MQPCGTLQTDRRTRIEASHHLLPSTAAGHPDRSGLGGGGRSQSSLGGVGRAETKLSWASGGVAWQSLCPEPLRAVRGYVFVVWEDLDCFSEGTWLCKFLVGGGQSCAEGTDWSLLSALPGPANQVSPPHRYCQRCFTPWVRLIQPAASLALQVPHILNRLRVSSQNHQWSECTWTISEIAGSVRNPQNVHAWLKTQKQQLSLTLFCYILYGF